MKILVIGNCQAHQLALCTNIIAPDAEASSFWPHEFGQKFGSKDEALSYVSGFDAVLSQNFHSPLVSTGEVSESAKRFLLYPNVQFSAYHPDCIYACDGAPGANCAGIKSPTGDYNSAIAIYSYVSGFDLTQTMRLFKSDVYDRLGYYNIWASAKAELKREFAAADTPFEAIFSEWHRAGVFMHSMNHPRLQVSESFAKILAPKLGLSTFDRQCSNYICDPNLFGEIWPLYPEIAERLALPRGEYTFKRAGNLLAESPKSTLFDLQGYVSHSLSSLSAFAPEAISCARIREWVADEALNDYLRSVAIG